MGVARRIKYKFKFLRKYNTNVYDGFYKKKLIRDVFAYKMLSVLLQSEMLGMGRRVLTMLKETVLYNQWENVMCARLVNSLYWHQVKVLVIFLKFVLVPKVKEMLLCIKNIKNVLEVVIEFVRILRVNRVVASVHECLKNKMFWMLGKTRVLRMLQCQIVGQVFVILSIEKQKQHFLNQLCYLFGRGGRRTQTRGGRRMMRGKFRGLLIGRRYGRRKFNSNKSKFSQKAFGTRFGFLNGPTRDVVKPLSIKRSNFLLGDERSKRSVFMEQFKLYRSVEEGKLRLSRANLLSRVRVSKKKSTVGILGLKVKQFRQVRRNKVSELELFREVARARMSRKGKFRKFFKHPKKLKERKLFSVLQGGLCRLQKEGGKRFNLLVINAKLGFNPQFKISIVSKDVNLFTWFELVKLRKKNKKVFAVLNFFKDAGVCKGLLAQGLELLPEPKSEFKTMLQKMKGPNVWFEESREISFFVCQVLKFLVVYPFVRQAFIYENCNLWQTFLLLVSIKFKRLLVTNDVVASVQSALVSKQARLEYVQQKDLLRTSAIYYKDKFSLIRFNQRSPRVFEYFLSKVKKKYGFREWDVPFRLDIPVRSRYKTKKQTDNVERFRFLKIVRRYYGNFTRKQLWVFRKIAFTKLKGSAFFNSMLLFESRLDFFLVKVQLCQTQAMARNWVEHGVVIVNGKQIFNFRYCVSFLDLVSIRWELKKKFRKFFVSKLQMELETVFNVSGKIFPTYIEFDSLQFLFSYLAAKFNLSVLPTRFNFDRGVVENLGKFYF